ncbi:MAG: right-handed parallel beta-helix repeat-containing protein [Opitutaceae bacterium]
MKNTHTISLAVALTALSLTGLHAANYGDGTSNYTNNIGSVTYPAKDTTVFAAAGKWASGIQNAIDDAAADGGGTVTMANKTWKLGKPVQPASRVRLRGSGKYTTILKRNFTPNSSQALLLNDATQGGATGGLEDMEFQYFTLDGNYTTSYLLNNDTFHAFYLNARNTGDYYYKTALRDVFIKRTNVGILLGGLRHFTLMNVSMDQNGPSNLAHQYYSRRMGNVRFTGCDIYRSLAGSGVKMTGGGTNFSWENRTFWIENSSMSDNTRSNFNTNANGYMRIQNNTFSREDRDDAAGIWLGYQGDLGGQYWIQYKTDIINNIIEDNGGMGIFTEYADDTWIRGNYADDNAEGNYMNEYTSDYSSDNNTSW